MSPIIRKRDLCGLLGVSSATVWRWTRRKAFPAPIKLGPNTVGWLRSEIDAWLGARVTERGEEQS